MLSEYLNAAIPALVLLCCGMGLQRVKAVKPVFHVIDWVVMWVMLPAVVFSSIACQTRSQMVAWSGAIIFAFMGVGACFVISTILSYVLNYNRAQTVNLAMNSSFMNVTHLGLPMVYGILGAEALAPATFYAMIVGVLNIILGTALASSVKEKRISIRELSMRVITFPAVFALFVALLFVGFGALPHTEVIVALGYITKPAFVLMLLLVGYEMPFVNPKKHALNLGIVGTLRLLICPLVTLVCMSALGLGLLDKTPKPSLIMAIMPPAVFNIILAHNYKLNMEEYGAMIFYITFVSVFLALPLMMLLLGF